MYRRTLPSHCRRAGGRIYSASRMGDDAGPFPRRRRTYVQAGPARDCRAPAGFWQCLCACARARHRPCGIVVAPNRSRRVRALRVARSKHGEFQDFLRSFRHHARRQSFLQSHPQGQRRQRRSRLRRHDRRSAALRGRLRRGSSQGSADGGRRCRGKLHQNRARPRRPAGRTRPPPHPENL